jgi:hypothetical protein
MRKTKPAVDRSQNLCWKLLGGGKAEMAVQCQWQKAFFT